MLTVACGVAAVALANLAKKHSMDAEYESPYILEAIKEVRRMAARTGTAQDVPLLCS